MKKRVIACMVYSLTEFDGVAVADHGGAARDDSLAGLQAADDDDAGIRDTLGLDGAAGGLACLVDNIDHALVRAGVDERDGRDQI
jgi:hypothetical protein